MFDATYDGVIKSEFLTHIDEVCHKQTQPTEPLILARNAELRKNPGALRDLGKQSGESWGAHGRHDPDEHVREGDPGRLSTQSFGR